MIVLVMGVSRSGKSTLAKALAADLGWAFQEGDDLHPQTNIDKMKAGIALSDADRYPWLERVKAWIDEGLLQQISGVITCSALKYSYRSYLGLSREGVVLVHVTGRPEIIAERLKRRPAHFMAPALFTSQLDALEAPLADEECVSVDVETPTPQQAAAVKRFLGSRSAPQPIAATARENS
jgi:carbohydrate kinase (thermoresistant glucokinase family)